MQADLGLSGSSIFCKLISGRQLILLRQTNMIQMSSFFFFFFLFLYYVPKLTRDSHVTFVFLVRNRNTTANFNPTVHFCKPVPVH